MPCNFTLPPADIAIPCDWQHKDLRYLVAFRTRRGLRKKEEGGHYGVMFAEDQKFSFYTEKEAEEYKKLQEIKCPSQS